ncbi:hypothetical protein SAMN04487948_12923 [Halogranum amylolyticum]|uniref:IraD/Gp25-like domain-containing protein n=1 Tax=Halogranum amylolyticum TaxID=660520 RepID=A0A1H8WG40_9EURY|nr:GPW/gp25 family protein [Halogranum amylolyticum]SEP26601.1 hypothetical protein SAMN04487948_12923 [Halogranum amylolyticum]
MDTEFLGQGWAFPVRTDRRGQLALTAGETDIEASIRIILGTARGERVMRPDFGCGIHNYVFKTVNATTLHRVEEEVRRALLEWEARIEVTAVEVSAAEITAGRLLISVDYRVRKTNTESNLVYPFYIREGNSGE